MVDDSILVVADELDKAAARDLVDHMGAKFNITAGLWNTAHYYDNEAQMRSDQVVISVGGPSYNKLTAELIHHCKPWEEDGEIFVYVGYNKAVVYGYSNSRTCRVAVKVFIKYYLEDFLRECDIIE